MNHGLLFLLIFKTYIIILQILLKIDHMGKILVNFNRDRAAIDCKTMLIVHRCRRRCRHVDRHVFISTIVTSNVASCKNTASDPSLTKLN